MNKFIILLILVLGIGINGCEENVKIVDLSQAHLDDDFKSFMTNNANLKARFLETSRTEKAIEIFRLAVENSDLEKISEKLNFSSIQEFDKFGSSQKAVFDRFIAKYPNLMDENGLNLQKFGPIIDAYNKNGNEIVIQEKINGRTKGCVGGVCLQQLVHCYVAAEDGFALGAAMCLTIVYNMPFYGTCMAGVLLTYTADNAQCINFYDDCCAP